MPYDKQIALIGDLGASTSGGWGYDGRRGVVYRVSSVDTLAAIARRYLGDARHAARLWAMQDETTRRQGFRPGVALKMPRQVEHTARRLGLLEGLFDPPPPPTSEDFQGQPDGGIVSHSQSSDHAIGTDTTQDWWKSILGGLEEKLNPWWAKPVAAVAVVGAIVFFFPEQTAKVIKSLRDIGKE